MIIENQVCSLELSKKLKELGVEQESCFSWVIQSVKESFLEDTKTALIINIIDDKEKISKPDLFSAFTVAELGEMLPKSIKYGGKNVPLEYRGENSYGEHLVTYHINFESPIGLQCEKTEADARAKMLIYLLENNLIENK